MAYILELRRVMPAPPSDVYAAFVDGLREWWGPEGFTIPSADFDPAPGRPYRIEMQPPEGDAFFLNGEFRDVELGARLSFTFNWDPPAANDAETLVELTFGDAVELRQGEFKTEERVELHRGGWTESFNKLERYLRV